MKRLSTAAVSLAVVLTLIIGSVAFAGKPSDVPRGPKPKPTPTIPAPTPTPAPTPSNPADDVICVWVDEPIWGYVCTYPDGTPEDFVVPVPTATPTPAPI